MATQPSSSVPTVKVTKPEDNNNSILDEPLCKYLWAGVGTRGIGYMYMCIHLLLGGQKDVFAQHMGWEGFFFFSLLLRIQIMAGFWTCQLIIHHVSSSSSYSHCLDRSVGIDVLRCY